MKINYPVHISKLSADQAKELQELLNKCGYNLVVDGIVGNQTLNVFNQFKRANNLTQPDIVGKTTVDWLNRCARREVSKVGLDLIKEFESFRSEAYMCPSNVATIGYGSTFYLDGRSVKIGDKITREESEQLLVATVQMFADEVSKVVKVPLNSNQFSALVSLCFNIGVGAFKKSTLLKLLNNKDYRGASKQFLRWNRGGNKILSGLTRRRVRERELFDSTRVA